MAPNRIYQPYIDGGEIALPVKESLAVFDGPKDILSPFLGTITFETLRAIKNNPSEINIRPDRLVEQMRRSPFIAILSQRPIAIPVGLIPEKSARRGLDGICYFRNSEDRSSGSIVIASVGQLRTETEMDDAITILAHEIGHSYGLEHCIGRTCLMSQAIPSGDRHKYATKLSGLFCSSHMAAIEKL